jgi:rubrerythrin
LNCYSRDAALISKLHAVTLTGAEYQTHDYYMNIGPLFSDPLARQLYAEIASVEAQHITHYGSMLNPEETLLEKLLIQEATEVFNYLACVEQETNPRIKAIWERFLDYELGHLQLARRLFEDTERRDAAEVLGDGKVPKRIQFVEHRDFVRTVLEEEEQLRKDGVEFVESEEEEGESSLEYRDTINSAGSPSTAVSEGYVWTPGTELARQPRAA